MAEAQRTAQLVASRLTLDTASAATNEGLDRELSRWRTALSPMCIGLAHASGELRSKDRDAILQCASLDHVKSALQSDSHLAASGQYAVRTATGSRCRQRKNLPFGLEDANGKSNTKPPPNPAPIAAASTRCRSSGLPVI